MDINLHEITIRDLFDKYYEDDENGIVTGYHGQRSFIWLKILI